jgi:hypothetical protein
MGEFSRAAEAEDEQVGELFGEECKLMHSLSLGGSCLV